MENDTPETDEAISNYWPMRYGYPGWDGKPPLEKLARRLERERDEARKLAEEMRWLAEEYAAMPIVTDQFPWENAIGHLPAEGEATK